MTLQLVILTFALLALIEGVFVIIFPKATLNLVKQLTKNTQALKKVALTEIVLAVVIALAAFYLI